MAVILVAASLFSQAALAKYDHQKFVGTSYEKTQAYLFADGLAEAIAIYTVGSTSETELQISAALTALTNIVPGFVRLYIEGDALESAWRKGKTEQFGDDCAKSAGLKETWKDAKDLFHLGKHGKTDDEYKMEKGILCIGVGSKLALDFLTHIYGIAKDVKKFSSAAEMAKANKKYGSYARKRRIIQLLELAFSYSNLIIIKARFLFKSDSNFAFLFITIINRVRDQILENLLQ